MSDFGGKADINHSPAQGTLIARSGSPEIVGYHIQSASKSPLGASLLKAKTLVYSFFVLELVGKCTQI